MKLDKIKKLAEAATDGPWVIEGSGHIPTIKYYDSTCSLKTKPSRDEEYIAAVNPEFILKLIEDHERLRDCLEEVESYMVKTCFGDSMELCKRVRNALNKTK